MTIPSVGRVVHYTAPDGRCVAAIVSDDLADRGLLLTTFPGTGPNVVAGVSQDPGQSAGTWHWPERV